MTANLLAPATSDLFGISHFDKMTAAQRELDMRRRVYPRRIEEGKMTEAQATRQIALMQAMVDDYALLAAVDAPMVRCRPVTMKLGDEGPVMIVDTSIERPKDVPRRVDLSLQLDAYTATEAVRTLLPWLALHAGSNWSRVVNAFEQAQAGRVA